MHAFDPDWQAVRRAVPARLRVDAGAGARPLRLRRAAAAARRSTDREALLTGTRETLVRAVRQQMMGDVNVGVFLSGGLDSSLVAAIASRIANERGRRLQTFAVGTEGSPDLAAARQVAEHLDCEHVEVTYTAAEALESLPNVVRAIESFDPGLVRSAVPNYMLARTTRQHVKVVLTGEGADELFAGYEYMREFTDDAALHAELERTVRSLHNLNLQRCDRVTMAHAVEARVPFLDRSVIAWALRIPPAEKQGKPEKKLLRESFEGWLPDELLWRTKAEFGDGSGARDVLTRAVEETVSDAEFEAERGAVEPALRTKEELAYYRVWREHLQGISAERTLSRFARRLERERCSTLARDRRGGRRRPGPADEHDRDGDLRRARGGEGDEPGVGVLRVLRAARRSGAARRCRSCPRPRRPAARPPCRCRRARRRASCRAPGWRPARETARLRTTLSERTIRGDGCTPRLAIVAPTAAIDSGVARSRSWPIDAAPTARSSLRSRREAADHRVGHARRAR